MPISSKPIVATSSASKKLSNAPRRAPMPDVVATAIAAAHSTIHDESLPLQKRTLDELNEVDPSKLQPLPHARQRIMAHLDELAGEAQAAEKRQINKAQAQARHIEQAAEAAAAATVAAAPVAKKAASARTAAGKMLAGMATAEFAKAVKDSEKAGEIEERRHGNTWKKHGEMAQEAEDAAAVKRPAQKAAPAKEAAGAGAAAKMAAGMATAEFAKAVKDSEKAGEIEERRHGDLWKLPGEGCSSCDENSATSTPSSAEREGKPLNAKGQARLQAQKQAAAPRAAGAAAGKMLAGMATAEFAKAVKDSEKAGEIEERRHGNTWKKHGEMAQEAEDAAALKRPAQKAAPAKQAAAGTAAGKMLAGMATAEFAKAVKDSEKAGEIEERRHGNVWKKHGEMAQEAEDEESATSTPSSAEREGKPLNAKGKARAAAGASSAAAKMAAGMATAEFAKAVKDSEKAGEIEERRHGNTWKKHGEIVEEAIDSVIVPKPAAAPKQAAAPRAAPAAGAAAGKMLAGMATAEFAKAVKDSEKAGEIEERRHGNTWKKHGEMAQEAEDAAALKRPAQKAAPAKQAAAGAAAGKMLAGMATAEFAKAVKDSEKAGEIEERRHGNVWKTRGEMADEAEDEESATSTPSSAEREGKPLNAKGLARLQAQKQAAALRAATTGGAAAGKMLAGMATAEFAKAVKDSEKAGEIEERRHGNVWKTRGEMAEEAEDEESSQGSATTTPSSAERKQKPLNVAGIRRMRAEYAARAGVTLPATTAAPSKRAASAHSSSSSSCTSTPSSAERKGKNLKPSGVAQLRRELEAQFPAQPSAAARAAFITKTTKKGAKAAAAGDVDAAKLVAGMATAEFAKAVKDSEKAGEIEERRHGNLWKKHGEMTEEAADAKAMKRL